MPDKPDSFGDLRANRPPLARRRRRKRRPQGEDGDQRRDIRRGVESERSQARKPKQGAAEWRADDAGEVFPSVIVRSRKATATSCQNESQPPARAMTTLASAAARTPSQTTIVRLRCQRSTSAIYGRRRCWRPEPGRDLTAVTASVASVSLAGAQSGRGAARNGPSGRDKIERCLSREIYREG